MIPYDGYLGVFSLILSYLSYFTLTKRETKIFVLHFYFICEVYKAYLLGFS